MRELGPVSGIYAFEEWERRRREGAVELMRDLSDTREDSGRPRSPSPMVVDSFIRLVDVAAFLAVMNKNLTLLYRGQKARYPLLPTLYRSDWLPPGRGQQTRVPIDGDERLHYWATLEKVEPLVLEILFAEGLPRWRHLERRRPARWAVIQHYGLWPTPLLDFTTSLRVGASFAFGVDRRASEGFLSIVGVRRVRSDLMPLKRNDAHERETGVLAIRLNSVCPPSAMRPHLQYGVLVGCYPFEPPGSADVRINDAAPIVIATLKLVNNGPFWSRDFPIHRVGSLLPSERRDQLSRRLRGSVRYRREPSGRLTVRAGGVRSARQGSNSERRSVIAVSVMNASGAYCRVRPFGARASGSSPVTGQIASPVSVRVSAKA
jgi:hypothetical protein